MPADSLVVPSLQEAIGPKDVLLCYIYDLRIEVNIS